MKEREEGEERNGYAAFFFFKERERERERERGWLLPQCVASPRKKGDQSGVAMGERIKESSNWSKYVRVVAVI